MSLQDNIIKGVMLLEDLMQDVRTITVLDDGLFKTINTTFVVEDNASNRGDEYVFKTFIEPAINSIARELWGLCRLEMCQAPKPAPEPGIQTWDFLGWKYPVMASAYYSVPANGAVVTLTIRYREGE